MSVETAWGFYRTAISGGFRFFRLTEIRPHASSWSSARRWVRGSKPPWAASLSAGRMKGLPRCRKFSCNMTRKMSTPAGDLRPNNLLSCGIVSLTNGSFDLGILGGEAASAFRR